VSGERRRRSGYTLIELTAALVILAVVLASLQLTLVAQRRFYLEQRLIGATRDAARVALEVLSGEIRGASPAAGDLYAIAPDSLALRSTLGLAVVCGSGTDVLHLRRLAGWFDDSPGDSALVFVNVDPRSPRDDAWTALPVIRLRADGSGLCPDGRAPDLALVTRGSLEGISRGSPLRAFRPVTYRLYPGRGGAWWLGQRLPGGDLQPIAGPFLAPAHGGLVLGYRARDGSAAGLPVGVSTVKIQVIARSLRPLPRPRAAAFHLDTLTTVVYVRNS
jgi:prepilin-type N-terminal cleavage/methylation domain-containing protein